jgi:hypothetical protein
MNGHNKWSPLSTERFRKCWVTLEQISWCIRMSITALLMLWAKGISIVSEWVMYKSSMKEVYKDLYTTDNQTRATFILKDPSSKLTG